MDVLVNLDVDDLEKAVRFYSSAFGLKVGRRFAAFGVEMLGGSVPIYLLVKSPGTPASAATPQLRNYQRHWTPVHLDFVVDEIEPAVDKAVSAGARLEHRLLHTSGASSLSWPIPSAMGSASSSSLGEAMTRLPSSDRIFSVRPCWRLWHRRRSGMQA